MKSLRTAVYSTALAGNFEKYSYNNKCRFDYVNITKIKTNKYGMGNKHPIPYCNIYSKVVE